MTKMTPKDRKYYLKQIPKLRDNPSNPEYGLTFKAIGKRLELSGSLVSKLYREAIALKGGKK